MRSALLFLTLVSWALWFGGTVASLIFGKHFFAVFPRDVAGEAARAMFQIFARYELALAAITLIASAMLLVNFPSKGLAALLFCLVLAGGMTVTVTLGFMPAMESLRDQGKKESPAWIKLHVKSMIAAAAQSGVLAVSGAVLLSSRLPPAKLLNRHNPDEVFEKRAGLSQRV